MTDEEFTAHMNASAQQFAEMANRHRLNFRKIAALGLIPIAISAGFAVFFYWWMCLHIPVMLWMAVDCWRDGQRAWDRCMGERENTFDSRDRVLKSCQDRRKLWLDDDE